MLGPQPGRLRPLRSRTRLYVRVGRVSSHPFAWLKHGSGESFRPVAWQPRLVDGNKFPQHQLLHIRLAANNDALEIRDTLSHSIDQDRDVPVAFHPEFSFWVSGFLLREAPVRECTLARIRQPPAKPRLGPPRPLTPARAALPCDLSDTTPFHLRAARGGPNERGFRYPAGTDNVSRRRTIAPNSRRVRCPSARSTQ